jgi:hypothetical protein
MELSKKILSKIELVDGNAGRQEQAVRENMDRRKQSLGGHREAYEVFRDGAAATRRRGAKWQL